MIDAIVRSTLFGLRNADKVTNTDDKGRILAEIGQFTNALTNTAELDNKLGKGAQAAISAMATASKESSVLRAAGKGATWAAKNVNPLLIGAAGYRVLIADDKGAALKKETLGMASMFFVEGLMKDFFKSNLFTNLKGKVKNKYIKAGISILEGILFVCGSIAGSKAGYKLGENLIQNNKKVSNNQSALQSTPIAAQKIADNKSVSAQDDYEQEFFIPGQGKQITA